jgi:hypothetical protein
MITKVDGLKYADLILNLINFKLYNTTKKSLINIISKYCFVNCFDNCREQGYVISIFNTNSYYIAFANQRNSDQIVVYEYAKTEGYSKLPSEEDVNGWNKPIFFKTDHLDKAAEYILSIIKNKLKDK